MFFSPTINHSLDSMILQPFNMVSAQGQSYVDTLFPQAILRRYFSAGAYGICHGNTYCIRQFGMHSHLGIGLPEVSTHASSRFDVASITKAIPVTLLVLWAASNDLLHLEQPVSFFFPGMRAYHSVDSTIRGLLSYNTRLHLDHLAPPFAGLDSRALIEEITKADFTVKPSLCYNNHSPILLGLILEQVTGKPLDQLAKEVLFDPLRMDNTTFSPTEDINTYVATEAREKGHKPICGVVHDELSFAIGRPNGGSGLFSTVTDLLKALRFILNKGAIGGKQVIREEYMSLLGQNQFPKPPYFGLGFGLWRQFANGLDDLDHNTAPILPDHYKGGFFKNGFTGSTVAIFPEVDVGIVLLTNHIHPQRRGNSVWINRFRFVVVTTLLTGSMPNGTIKLWRD